MAFQLTKNDISSIAADAVVTVGGTPGAVRRGFGKYSITAAASDTPEGLTASYLEALETAGRKRCGRVAMALPEGPPAPDTRTALRAAVRAISIYLRSHDMSVTLSVPEGLDMGGGFYDSLRQYIAQRYTGISAHGIFERQFFRAPPSASAPAPAPAPVRSGLRVSRIQSDAAPVPESLESMLRDTDAGFSQTLLSLIDKSGRKDSEVYKRANIDRKLFSKIRSNPAYRPSKSTALALAVALELDLDGVRDLISRAGYSLTHANRGDIIVEYFILRGVYDIFEINETLFAFDQPLLGGS